jgi:hypothetical protein
MIHLQCKYSPRVKLLLTIFYSILRRASPEDIGSVAINNLRMCFRVIKKTRRQNEYTKCLTWLHNLCTATIIFSLELHRSVTWCWQERRKKEREVEEKRLAAERAAEDARRRAEEVWILLVSCPWFSCLWQRFKTFNSGQTADWSKSSKCLVITLWYLVIYGIRKNISCLFNCDDSSGRESV